MTFFIHKMNNQGCIEAERGDGYLTPQVVMNFNHLLEVIDKQLLVGLTIFPETNGTLLIDCTDKEAGISLGNDKFSYYIIKDGQVMGD